MSTRMSTGWKLQSGRRRPVENLILVDVDQENVCGVNVNHQRLMFIKRQDGDGRRRPVEKLSLVDIDQLKTSVVDVDQ